MCDCNRRHHAAGMAFFCAMREKLLGSTRGAGRRNRDLPGWDSGLQQLSAIGFAQVEMELEAEIAVSGRALVHKQQWILLVYGVGLLDFMKKLAGVGKL
jgi:hypothetical protein